MATEATERPLPWSERPLAELKREILARTGRQVPFVRARSEDVQRALDRLPSLGHEDWARAWSSVAEPYWEQGREAEAGGDPQAAHDAYLQAWTYFSIARYPAPSSPPKRTAYERARAAYLAAAHFLPYDFERVEVPFPGRAEAGEGDRVVLYVHRPRGVARPPVVLLSGGIDQYKEEAHAWAQPYVQAGLCAVTYDIPGTGESPIKGVPDGERIYDAILPYLAERADLDGGTLGLVGRSFGGHWATKAAHTHARYLRAVVNWGGSIHGAFQPVWIEQSRSASSYLFELLETRAFMLGQPSAEAYLAAATALSLLDQGLLDRPCAPMLLVNGKDDQQVPIADLYLLLEHGDPKEARVFPGGHLGPVAEVDPLVRAWMIGRLKGA